MQIIPVIDIKNGIAVHARRGDRANYAPLISRFGARADPSAIVAGLVEALHVTAVYIADLDAINGKHANSTLLTQLATEHPHLRFILDRGLTPHTPVAGLLDCDNIDLVIASETLATVDEYRVLRERVPANRCLLSLDRNGDVLLGPPDLFSDSHRWPSQVIHMNLALVGSDGGPDWPGLMALIERAAGRDIIAAGGVRHDADVRSLAQMNVAAVLVGTALHDGRIDGSQFL
jgi:HisA/HisF family protein